MAQAQTPISAFVPSKTEYIKTDMFSDHKKLNGTDRKTAKLDQHLDGLSSNFLASQFAQDEDEPEPRRIETEIARVSQAPNNCYYGLSESKTFDGIL